VQGEEGRGHWKMNPCCEIRVVGEGGNVLNDCTSLGCSHDVMPITCAHAE